MASDRESSEDQRIVAVGLLTQREVTLLGSQLSRLYPLEDDDAFADLVEAVDRADREFHRQMNAGR